MSNNWRKVLSWATEEDIEQDKERKSWEAFDVPFTKDEAYELLTKLKYVSGGEIHYSFLPNIFFSRLTIKGGLEYHRTVLQDKAEKLEELLTFYNNLLNKYPVGNPDDQ